MKRIVITGGPCAGKTMAIQVLKERLEQAHVEAVFVPEAATDLIMSGFAPWELSSMVEFQMRVMALQIEREAQAAQTAKDAGLTDALIICDRGLCDGGGYIDYADYLNLLAANNLSESEALARYDAVFCLESAAKGTPGAYTVANNEARFEDLDEAVATDDRVIASWAAHPNVTRIPFMDDFEQKIDMLVDGVMRLASQR